MIEGPLFRSLVRLFGSRELLHILILGPGLVQAGRDRMRHIMFKSSQMVALLVSLVTLKLYAFPLHLNLCEEWSQKEENSHQESGIWGIHSSMWTYNIALALEEDVLRYFGPSQSSRAVAYILFDID